MANLLWKSIKKGLFGLYYSFYVLARPGYWVSPFSTIAAMAGLYAFFIFETLSEIYLFRIFNDNPPEYLPLVIGALFAALVYWGFVRYGRTIEFPVERKFQTDSMRKKVIFGNAGFCMIIMGYKCLCEVTSYSIHQQWLAGRFNSTNHPHKQPIESEPQNITPADTLPSLNDLICTRQNQ